MSKFLSKAPPKFIETLREIAHKILGVCNGADFSLDMEDADKLREIADMAESETAEFPKCMQYRPDEVQHEVRQGLYIKELEKRIGELEAKLLDKQVKNT